MASTTSKGDPDKVFTAVRSWRCSPSPSCSTVASKKRHGAGRRLNQACRPSVTVSPRLSPDCRRNDACIVANGSTQIRSLNKSAKVVLALPFRFELPTELFKNSRCPPTRREGAPYRIDASPRQAYVHGNPGLYGGFAWAIGMTMKERNGSENPAVEA